MNILKKRYPFHPLFNFEMAQLFVDKQDKMEAVDYLVIALSAWQNADQEFQPALAARELYIQLLEGEIQPRISQHLES